MSVANDPKPRILVLEDNYLTADALSEAPEWKMMRTAARKVLEELGVAAP